jgi:hypothetical protein
MAGQQERLRDMLNIKEAKARVSASMIQPQLGLPK